MVTEHLIETDEAERVAAYQRGWNDSAAGRTPAAGEPIMYTMGFVDNKFNAHNRFEAQS